MFKHKFLLPILLLVTPFLASAQNVDSLITKVSRWVGNLVPILVGVALLFFIWNVVKLIRTEKDDERKEAKMGMWWAIIAMFVIISIWGIVTFIRNTLGVTTQSTIDYPKPPGSTFGGFTI